MNKLISLLLLAIFFAGCSEDFQVTAPYKDITVVYGLLNIRDTAHYIRIQKAFLDEHKSALDMAKEPDSNFYAQLDVRIKEFNSGALVDNISLLKVDLNLEGYPKEPGSFFTGPSWAYKFKKTLQPSHTYRLVILNPLNGKTDSAEINVLDTTILCNIFTQGDYKFRFSKTTSNTKLNLQTISPPSNASYIEQIIRFKWVDTNILTNTSVDKSADFVTSSPVPPNQINFSIPNSTIYSFLSDEMGTAPTNIHRYLSGTEYYIYAAGKDLYDYLKVTQAQSNGLTAEQIKPLFTNIKGPDVLGIFSSRVYRYKLDIPIDSTTLDSLMENPVTQPLNIKGFSGR